MVLRFCDRLVVKSTVAPVDDLAEPTRGKSDSVCGVEKQKVVVVESSH